MDWFTDALNSMYEYLTGADLWIWIGKTIFRIVVIVVLSFAVKFAGNKVIDAIFTEKKHIPIQLTTNRREQTLKNLLKNVLSYIIAFIAIMMILDLFNVPIKTMLAGAGVVGLAIGFGAQSLVKDIISGFFIIFEDQFSVGDYITASGAEGTVEVIGLRTTKIMSWTGEQFVIPNGNIEQVTNYSVHNGLAVVDINLPYESDIIQVEKMITEIIEAAPEKYDMFVGKPTIHGVQLLELSNYVIRVIAETQPVFQWAGARALRKEIKDQLYTNGIEIPSPRMVVYSKGDKEKLEEDM